MLSFNACFATAYARTPSLAYYDLLQYNIGLIQAIGTDDLQQ